MAAGELAQGNSITSRAGPKLNVVSVSWQRQTPSELSAGSQGYTVYNFEVAKTHTFFVGVADGGTWVHNVKVKCFPNFDAAREAAFEELGMTDPANVTLGAENESGTVVEFHGPNGEKIAYDGPHLNDPDPDKGHDKPHVGLQWPGKRPRGGRDRWNYTYDGPPGPARL